jgi:hypothetical protein
MQVSRDGARAAVCVTAQHRRFCVTPSCSTRWTKAADSRVRAVCPCCCAACDSSCKASGKARLIAGMEEEEFKGDVTDACVIDRGNGEYQVGLSFSPSRACAQSFS